MEPTRKPGQGVLNIVRFNWHFYVIAGTVLAFTAGVIQYLPAPLQPWALGGLLLAGLTMIVSLVVSWYVYDRSDLYQLRWLAGFQHRTILNINAGFDETSAIIKAQFPEATFTSADFYNPEHHTEISIQRARRAYPPPTGTVSVSTQHLPFPDGAFEGVLAILSAHEIREEQERICFFRELGRVTAANGRIFVTEHLRDWPNFAAYTVGFLHFHSETTWRQTFAQAGLLVQKTIKTTPFITTFILSVEPKNTLQQHGNSL